MSATELAPVSAVDTAVSYRCQPRAGHLCWQYDPTAQAIPLWVLEYVTGQTDKRLEFCDRNGSTGVIFEPGDWLVLFDHEEGLVAVYPAAEFEATFKCVFQ